MKSFAPCLAVVLAGVVLMMGAAVAMATDPGARGGHAVTIVPTTTKTPALPKQNRGSIVVTHTILAASCRTAECGFVAR